MHHTIQVVARPGRYWWLLHGGEGGEIIKKTTGTYLTPTPFDMSIPVADVEAAIRQIDPNAKVVNYE